MGLCPHTSFYKSALQYCLLLSAVVLVSGCGVRGKELGEKSSVCGSGEASSFLDGLFWLNGEPTSANVVCSVQGGQYRTVQILAPDSRDPILLNDRATKQKLLVERFSGSTARPSRATWVDSSGEIVTQRGDWPQNVYSVIRVSASQALVTGFDFADLRRFVWASEQSESLGFTEPLQLQTSDIHPILTLRSGAWMATLDAGFDLQKFLPKTARAFVFQEDIPESRREIMLADTQQRLECKNAYQFLQLSNSRALLSCNPQYFGAVDGEQVGVFSVELSEQGELLVRSLLTRASNQVQKIDLWGVSPSGERAFVGLKQTRYDDYSGKVLESGWLSWRDGAFTPENRFAGPIAVLSSSSFVCSCERDTEICRNGEFLAVDESKGRNVRIPRDSSLPFLSFAVDIPQP
ncbi:MAG: hypothetical protein RI932_1164 [Pseudomonadota bacterium]|jgi:hypothetical protein